MIQILYRALACLGLVVLPACGLFSQNETDPNVEYKQAVNNQRLEVPPQIGLDERDQVMRVPLDGKNKLSHNVLLPELSSVRWKRTEKDRWLEIETNAEQLWPVLRDFWGVQGLLVERDEPLLGIIETAWAERHEVLPQSGIRSVLRGAFSAFYSAKELDKYRIRVERLSKGKGVRLFLQHRGFVETSDSSGSRDNKGTNKWLPGESNRILEDEMMARLLVYLGVAEQRARGLLSNSEAQKLTTAAYIDQSKDGDTSIVVSLSFYKAWIRTEDALDELGWDIEESLEGEKRFDITFKGDVPEAIAKEINPDPGWFESATNISRSYQIYLLEEPGRTRLRISDATGETSFPKLEAELMRRLHEQLK